MRRLILTLAAALAAANAVVAQEPLRKEQPTPQQQVQLAPQQQVQLTPQQQEKLSPQRQEPRTPQQQERRTPPQQERRTPQRQEQRTPPPMEQTSENPPYMHMLYDRLPDWHEMRHDCRHLTLDIDVSDFFFDAEYETPMAKGFTVTGFHLAPTLSYGINERARLSLGFKATAFAGLDSLYRLRPSLSLTYTPAKWLTLVAGTIYGGYNHKTGLPAYDPSLWIYDPQEEGLQILTNTKVWNSDTWLDWTNYLTPWTRDQETFTMGSRHNVHLINYNHKADTLIGLDGHRLNDNTLRLAVDVPLHFIACHRGGEVKSFDTNTVTTFNKNIGLRIHLAHSNIAKPRTHLWTLNLPFYFYNLEDNDLDHSGKGFYPTLDYTCSLIAGGDGKTKKARHSNPDGQHASATDIHAGIGYWHGDHYFSRYGSPQFWSVNAYSSLHMPPSAALASVGDVRDMLTMRIAIEHEFKSLHLGLQVEALHDVSIAKTDFFFGFYMRFVDKFLLF